MVFKATNNGSSAANAEPSKRGGKRTTRKGSRVTEARAQAQRAKLDQEAEARHVQEERENAGMAPDGIRVVTRLK
jgi:hypothetical protein